MPVQQELLQDNYLPGLNRLFIYVAAAAMAAKERGESSIDVWVSTREPAKAAAPIFNQTDGRASVQGNEAVRLHLKWVSGTAQFSG